MSFGSTGSNGSRRKPPASKSPELHTTLIDRFKATDKQGTASSMEEVHMYNWSLPRLSASGREVREQKAQALCYVAQ